MSQRPPCRYWDLGERVLVGLICPIREIVQLSTTPYMTMKCFFHDVTMMPLLWRKIQFGPLYLCRQRNVEKTTQIYPSMYNFPQQCIPASSQYPVHFCSVAGQGHCACSLPAPSQHQPAFIMTRFHTLADRVAKLQAPARWRHRLNYCNKSRGSEFRVTCCHRVYGTRSQLTVLV